MGGRGDQWHSFTDGSVRGPITQMDVFINNYYITNLNSVSSNLRSLQHRAKIEYSSEFLNAGHHLAIVHVQVQ